MKRNCACSVAEEFISGPEFSCDVVLQDGESFSSGKRESSSRRQAFRECSGLHLSPEVSVRVSETDSEEVLKKATSSLGFDWGFFMVDYILHQGKRILIEMTPVLAGTLFLSL